MVLPAFFDKKYPWRLEDNCWGSEFGNKEHLRPVTPQLKKRFWQVMKGLEPKASEMIGTEAQRFLAP